MAEKIEQHFKQNSQWVIPKQAGQHLKLIKLYLPLTSSFLIHPSKEEGFTLPTSMWELRVNHKSSRICK